MHLLLKMLLLLIMFEIISILIISVLSIFLQFSHKVHIEVLCEVKKIHLQQEFLQLQQTSLAFPKEEKNVEPDEGRCQY